MKNISLKIFCLSVFLVLSWMSIHAQGGLTITGVVHDKTGETVIGATVAVKGTTNGTITNIDGKYSLTVPNSGAVLKFSFIGYLPQEITVGNKTTIDVTLEDDTKTLDEVVVTALGIQRDRKSLGYAISFKKLSRV